MKQLLLNTVIMVLLIGVSGLLYVRIGPLDVAALHVTPPFGATPEQPVLAKGAALYQVSVALAPEAALERFSEIALASPRTTLLAGGAQTGMVTYISRSRVFGFPDATTVRAVAEGEGSRLDIYGRLIYGRSDFGVNQRRIQGWLEALNQAR